MSVTSRLDKLHQAFSQACQSRTGQLPLIEHDSEWPSPCEVGEVNRDNMIQWQAIARQPHGTFTDLAAALEVTFPESLSQFYGSFYAGNIVTTLDDHHVELLQVWNEEDFNRLQQNITGHVLMKRKLKQPDTVFIGLTEQDDLLVTVLVETGQVCLEYVGKKPHHVLAQSIDSLLQSVTV